MKKIIGGFLVLILLALLLFTRFGEDLYALDKPCVELGWVSTYADSTDLFIPVTALREDEAGSFVYVLHSEEGYSRTIYTAVRRTVDALMMDSDRYLLSGESDVSVGDRVIVWESEPLENGERVIIR